MTPLAVFADVPNLAGGAGPAGHFRRVAGMLADNETVAVGRLVAGEAEAETEITFTLGFAKALAEACLSGDRRALTHPGLARILSATAAVLFRVAHQAGAFQAIEEFDGRRDDDLPADRGEAGADEDPD